MTTIVLRAEKGLPLTIEEVDTNFNNLNQNKIEVEDAVPENVVEKVVLRDESGNFAAGEITAESFNALSDRRLKVNIQPIPNAIQAIEAIEGVTFDWITTLKPAAGVIAQDIEQVLPHLVFTAKDGTKSVSYDGLIAYLIESVKTLNARVAELESK